MTLVIFFLEGIRYSLDVKNVEEVVPLPAITPLAILPFFIRGIINLRGSMVPIIDLRKRLGIGENQDDLDNEIIIVKFQNKTTGLIVDKVLSVVDVCEDQFIPPPEMIDGVDIRYMASATQIGSDLIIVLNLNNIFSLKESEELLGINVNHEDIKEDE